MCRERTDSLTGVETVTGERGFEKGVFCCICSMLPCLYLSRKEKWKTVCEMDYSVSCQGNWNEDKLVMMYFKLVICKKKKKLKIVCSTWWNEILAKYLIFNTLEIKWIQVSFCPLRTYITVCIFSSSRCVYAICVELRNELHSETKLMFSSLKRVIND